MPKILSVHRCAALACLVAGSGTAARGGGLPAELARGRDEAALAKLPEAERAVWRQPWAPWTGSGN
jgi:hypothetical protein